MADYKRHSPVSVYALGGLGEVGKNTYAIENDTTLILIDAGIRFPEDAMTGIDYVIPDYSHIRNNNKKFKALFITHGHEDHIGGIPFLMQACHIPVVYAPPLAAQLIRHKLKMMRVRTELKIVEYTEDDVFEIDDFRVSFFHVTHSIPDSFGICIDTPEGRIVTTGDFKVDLTPIGKDINLGKMAQIGNEGVDLFLSDSTNAEKEGYTPSERNVVSAINKIFTLTSGRLIISTFSSNISRIQQIIDASLEYNRKVVVIGSSMQRVVNASRELGYIKMSDKSLVAVEDIASLRPNETVILCTGSQGEPMAALSRIADNDHKDVRIIPGDTVVFSSSPIPGNGVEIDKVVNKLTRLGATVLTNSILTNIHSSGHPSEQELKLVLRIFRPKYFMPIHGEYRMLKLHADLATTVGVKEENTFVCKNGETLILKNHHVERGPSIPADSIYIDGISIDGVSDAVINDRKRLGEDGMCAVFIPLDAANNQLFAPINLYARGFVTHNASKLIPNAEDLVNESVNNIFKKGTTTYAEIKLTVKNVLEPYFYEKTGRSPMIIPLIMNKGN
ncbi:MAG: ribonuclease J [Bacilli bacterium]|jgi:ribonuclease J